MQGLGVSGATPLPAGVAALALSANPDLAWWEGRDILRGTAIDIDGGTLAGGANKDPDRNYPCGETEGECSSLGTGRGCYFGYGRIDAHKAVLEAIRRLP